MLPFELINMTRRAELEAALPLLRPGDRILEIGAGSGQQALDLANAGFRVAAIDLEGSEYSGSEIFPITSYDGTHIPFEDGSFDVIFSSNVLEHVPDLPAMHREFRRVLAPGGSCIHIVPTDRWRLWTSLAAFPSAARAIASVRNGRDLVAAGKRVVRTVLQKRHGERGNVITELYYFRPSWWRRHFSENGFEIVCERSAGLFYTAEGIMGERLSIESRRKLAATLGSACHLFQVRPSNPN